MAANIDIQRFKTTEAGRPRDFDFGKKIRSLKRHIVTNTQGPMLTFLVHDANIQDSDGALGIIGLACAGFPCIAHIFTDGACAGEELERALAKIDDPALEIFRHPDDIEGFFVDAK